MAARQASRPGALRPGDRLPDFIYPDQNRVNRQFYNELTGGPILLLAIGSSAPDRFLTALAARRKDLQELGSDAFAVTGRSVEANAELARAAGLERPVFADAKGELVGYLLTPEAPALPGVAPVAPGHALFVLDSNQRLLARLVKRDPDRLYDAALEILRDHVEHEVAPCEQIRSAPVLILPRVFDRSLCRRLIAAWQSEHHEGTASTGRDNVYAPDRKRTLEHVVTDPALEREVRQTLARRVGPELAKVFNFHPPFSFDGHVVMSYLPERGDFFGIHRDNLRGESPRRFALSLNLNEEFEGGGLRFPEYSPHVYRMPAGAACIFSCSLLHEAQPVTAGQRFVMTSFFCQPLPGAAAGA